jgi:AcrR family transcriptional regulator
VFDGGQALSSRNTKQRLLNAARALFAERGFHNATIREIALKANTNLASVNYYFKSKDDLYREILSRTFQTSVSNKAVSLHEDIAAQRSPEKRLRHFIRGLVHVGDSDVEADAEETRRLMAWEVLAPTGVIEAVNEWDIRLHLDAAKIVVEPFLPEGAASEEVMATAVWLIGQCLVFRKLAAHPDALSTACTCGTEALVDLIATRARGGLNAGTANG